MRCCASSTSLRRRTHSPPPQVGRAVKLVSSKEDFGDGIMADAMAALATREEKLLDLAEDGSLPREKIRARLRTIEIERVRAEQGLTETG